ncbi:nucleotide exchange factor GrpE [Pleomorphovibrio marinus]|uniref:nucleotide exchange factor GrpE n=1 Tax=Pleomorphovibrio marinus TaxID=2164132 RepID=UPI000E0C5FF8|nr:nucleotide exchange factor GrpE [Pleomorphovibrio marinus]
MAEEKEKVKETEEQTLDTAGDQPQDSSEGFETTGAKGDKNQEKEDKPQSKEEKLLVENQELKEKHLRLYSEFENYRRRTAKERLDLISTASEEVIKDLLPILDDFERSFKAGTTGENTEAQQEEGVKLIYHKMVKILASKGLKPMEGLVGEPFDAEKQEAITQIPAPSDNLKGKIVDVVEQGYLLGDKVVRYAKVVIGK